MPARKLRAPQGVRGLMLAKLATSLLDENDAKALMMRPADGAELAALGFPDADAFEIPYFDARGRPTGFRRWRYLGDPRSALERKTDRKPLRYVQGGGSMPEVYLPPLADWEAVMADPEVGIAVTEGELKAACCTKLGVPCVGLGGVYSFRSTRKGLPMVAALRAFKWGGRDVVVAYDSDASSNPMVVQARNELAKALLAMGANVRVVDPPPADDGSKQGIDDLALAKGGQALLDLLGSAPYFAAAEALHELNAEVAYVTDPGLVVVLETGQTLRASDFVGHAYANRHYMEVIEYEDAKGNVKTKMTRRKAAQGWLEWPDRQTLSQMAYLPGEERITATRAYNTWRGWGCEPKRGDVAPWRMFLDNLFAGRPEERSWFERWCALPLQRPGVKMYTCAVVWGRLTGTGKSLSGVSLGRIYGRNYAVIGEKELKSEGNAWLIGKQFALGDDVTGQEQRRHADRLKTMVTQETVRIDQKYVPVYEIPDVVNYMFTSNHPDAFFIEDDDRRFFVHEVRSAPLPRAFYKEYMSWLGGGGASHLFHHLLETDLGGMEPEDRAPENDAKKAMIEDGMSDVGRWVRRLLAEPDLLLRVGDARLEGDLWSSSDLVRLYDPEGRGRVTAGGLGRELKRAGAPQAYGGLPVRTSAGQARLFALRNAGLWTAPKVAMPRIVAHYDSTVGSPRRARKG